MTRLLLVKLADVGDLVTATPAIQVALDSGREVSVLTTPAAAPLLAALRDRVEVVEFPKAEFDSLRGAITVGGLARGARLAATLRRGRWDEVAILHHLTTAAGAAKYRVLALATGAPRVAGLDNGRGGFLTHPVADEGFGASPESSYCLRVLSALGIVTPNPPHPRTWADPIDLGRGRTRAKAYSGGFAAIHPGTGPAATARLWPPRHWASLVGSVSRDLDVPAVLVGGRADRAAVEAVVALVPGAIDVVGVPGFGDGEVSLGEIAGFLGEATVFVGADSGLLHVAAASGARTVGLYGPTDPAAWAPTGDHVTTVRSPVACSPCLYQAGRPPLEIACRRPFCMDAIDPATAMAAVRAQAGNRPHARAAATGA